MTHEQECIIEELENICINNEYVLELLAKLKNEEGPQGKWRNLPHRTSLRYKCSICGSFSRIKSLYCPWCGVNMEE